MQLVRTVSDSTRPRPTPDGARPRPAAAVAGRWRPAGHPSPDSDLLPSSWRRHLGVVLAACGGWSAAWAIAVRRGRGPLALERPLNDLLTASHPQLVHVAFGFAAVDRPVVFAGLMVVMVGLCAGGRSPRAAVVLAVSLPVTFGLVDLLKVVVGRVDTFGTLTFPSGHVGLTSVLATVAVLLARRRGPLGQRLPTAVRTAVVAVAVASVVAVAASMVILGAHFVTDTIAAAPIGLAVTLMAAAVVDSLARRPHRAQRSGRPHIGR